AGPRAAAVRPQQRRHPDRRGERRQRHARRRGARGVRARRLAGDVAGRTPAQSARLTGSRKETPMNVHASNFRDLAAAEFDTTTLLAHAAEQAIERRYEDLLIVDVDCHHYETEAFNEILQYMEDPVLRHEAKYQGMARGGIGSADGSYQELGGRITRYPGRRIEKVPPTPHRDITLMRRGVGAPGPRNARMFPPPQPQPPPLPPPPGAGGPGPP